MKRDTVFTALVAGASAWMFFLLHSCAAGDPHQRKVHLGDITRAPRIQVGLGAWVRVGEARFQVRGPCTVSGVRFPEGTGGTIRAVGGAIEIEGRRYGPAVRVEVERDGDLEAGGKRYHGDLLLLEDRGGVTLVNETDLEHYLAGVVGREMSVSRGREALKAQAIAARTYAMWSITGEKLRKVNGEKFDLFDDARSQVYGGVDGESTEAWNVVEETRGLFVVWEDGFVPAFYSSTCGGATDAAWRVLGEGSRIPPLAGRPCGHCEQSPHYRWEWKLGREEAARRLFEGEPKLRVEAVRVAEALPGGHAVRVGLRLEGHAVERMLHANLEFRRRLGLRSTVFDSIEVTGEEIVVRGRGWGHGAGMCQWGAYRMAELGMTGGEILEYYFPGARVKKIY